MAAPAPLTHQLLATHLLASLSPSRPVRQQAETALSQLRSQNIETFPAVLIGIVTDKGQDRSIRTAAAVFWKNAVGGWWGADDEASTSANIPPLSEPTKDTIKQQLVQIMISLGDQPSLQSQIAEAVARIAQYDFPDKWTTLPNQITQALSPTSFEQTNAVLSLAHSIFRRWRSEFRTDSLFLEIKFVLETFCSPYLEVFKAVDAQLSNPNTPPQQVPVLANTLILLLQLFYDLNCQDLPEFFEDNIDLFMSLLDKYLRWSHPAVVGDPEDPAPPLQSQIRSAICEITELYTQRYMDVFPHLMTFVGSVLALLTGGEGIAPVGPSPNEDIFVSKAIRFLSTVVRMPSQRENLEGNNTLETFCEKIVLPNMALREFEEEMFDDDWQEYVRRDLDNSTDTDTRRNAASEFTKALMEQFEPQVTTIITRYIGIYLSQYSANRQANWKAKDTAVFLLTSIASRTSSQSHGVTVTNALVNIVEFFTDHVASDLDGPNVHPIVRADAIKYLFTFRNQLSKEQLLAVIPMLLPSLQAEHVVLHTYAAITIEKILSMKNKDNKYIFNAVEIQPQAETIVNTCLTIIEKGNTPEQIAANDNLMKCLMRTLITTRQGLVPIFSPILDRLVKIIAAIAKNPSNPKFSHYTFESVSILIRFVVPASLETLNRFEGALLGDGAPFHAILHEEVWEFVPFVFQIVCQLLDLHTQNIPEFYQTLLPPILQVTLWEQRGNIPALVRLVKTFIIREPQSIVANRQLEPVLGIFKSLIANKANDQYGLELLEAIFRHIPGEILKTYFSPVFTLLITRLTSSRTEKLVLKFIRFLFYAFSMNKPDVTPDDIVAGIDSVQSQPGLFGQMMQGVIIANIPKVQTKDRRVVAVGLCDLLCRSRAMVNGANVSCWPATLEALLKLIILPQIAPDGHEEDLELQDLDATTLGYQAAFSKLGASESAAEDPVKRVTDVRNYLAVEMGNAAKQNPGKIGSLIDKVSPEFAQPFKAYLQQNNITVS